ncbi:uncharacterized protein LOC134856265 [Symsagittifera roscoffensis]|uniref:uncharacterized protein LOC134856265 n=1 Tax=Symsagittifera roscoffensis TaxID=84072 RepID=UPI00307C0F1E
MERSFKWKPASVAMKTAPLARGAYFIGLSRGGGKVQLLYTGSTHTQSNLRSTIRQVFTGGSIDNWDERLGCFLMGASKRHLLVDWVVLKFPQDTIGDYVLQYAKINRRLPMYNPPSEERWGKAKQPFFQY